MSNCNNSLLGFTTNPDSMHGMPSKLTAIYHELKFLTDSEKTCAIDRNFEPKSLRRKLKRSVNSEN